MMNPQVFLRYKYYFFVTVILLGVIVLIFIVNILSGKEEERPFSTYTTPSPVPPTRAVPTLPVTDEGNFTPEQGRQMLELRRQGEQAYQDRKRRLPFITQLPYVTNHFRIDILSTSDTVIITTFGAYNYDSQYRSEALQWLQANGGIPQSLMIKYQHQS